MNLKKYFQKRDIVPQSRGPFVSAVIVAAGNSERMHDINKIFMPLCGIPVIARTLSAFEKSSHVKEVVIVTKKANILRIASIIKEFGFSKVTNIVVGGETRQCSAKLGFKAINPDAEYIAVHDGARPLATSACIDKTIECAFDDSAAAAAVKVKDTIKIADDEGIVVSTPERSHMWAVQTPQVFKKDLYSRALEEAEKNGTDYTDDCQLVEALKVPVHIVEGEYTNIKITTIDDKAQAEAILRARGEAF